MRRRRLVRVGRACAAQALRCRRVRRHQLARATPRLRLACRVAMAGGVLVLVRAARHARACLRRAVRRDLLPCAAVRLRHASAARQVVAVVARRTRCAAMLCACRARGHAAVRARRALLELALAVARRRRRQRFVLRARARRMRRACATRTVRKRWRYLHVLSTRAHVHGRAQPVDGS